MEKGEGPQKRKRKNYILEKETGFTVEELRKVAESGKKEEREQRGEKNKG
jgi:hypothetical protein